tara:strand:+ start:206 stop:391 length:186 start_codon:yes stop_codon:yes gene_type:complete
MSTRSVAGFGLILKFFKVVGTSSRPLEVQGIAKYHAPLNISSLLLLFVRLLFESELTSLYP